MDKAFVYENNVLFECAPQVHVTINYDLAESYFLWYIRPLQLSTSDVLWIITTEIVITVAYSNQIYL